MCTGFFRGKFNRLYKLSVPFDTVLVIIIIAVIFGVAVYCRLCAQVMTVSDRLSNGPAMSTLRGSRNYVWDTKKLLGQGATSMVYVGREKVKLLHLH